MSRINIYEEANATDKRAKCQACLSISEREWRSDHMERQKCRGDANRIHDNEHVAATQGVNAAERYLIGKK